jgi:site-specific DNA-adenine methylase
LASHSRGRGDRGGRRWVFGKRRAAATLTTRTPATAATKVIVYEPFTGSGAIAPGIEVAGKPSAADCYIGSLASPRRDAFRCITERNFLIDLRL